MKLNPAANLSGGALGCYMSHIAIYRRMEVEGIQLALILEDDAVLLPQVKTLLDQGSRSLDFEYCFLGCEDRGDEGFVYFDSASAVPISGQMTMYKLSSGPYCTHAYLITLRGAKRRLECDYPARTAIDHYHYLPYRADIRAVIPLVAYVNEESAHGSMSLVTWSGIQTWSRQYWWYYPLRDIIKLKPFKKSLKKASLVTSENQQWRSYQSSFRVLPPWRR